MLEREEEEMEKINIPVSPLGSAGEVAIPLVGMGTAEFPFNDPSEAMKQSILHAINIGYRHFDSAAAYNSEKALGEVIKQALQLGLIQSRDELFITSKLWASNAHPHRVLPALQETLRNLGLEYLDLYLIHWPVSLKPGHFEIPFKKENLLAMDYGSVWKQMEDCQKLGLTKAIGVSNFSVKKLDQYLLPVVAEIPPAVNQVEMNPLWQQKKLREYCAEKGIHITAYSPLGARGAPWGGDRVMECQVLKDIAQARGKTIAQVCLRWIHEQGVSYVAKSYNKERMKENIEIMDWELSVEDREKIDQLQQFKSVLGVEFVGQDSCFKSYADLWDEEIPF